MMVLSGAIAGAWMAYQAGADPARSLRAVWDTLQDLLEEKSSENSGG